MSGPSPVAALRALPPRTRAALIALGAGKAAGLVLLAGGLAGAITAATLGRADGGAMAVALLGALVRAGAGWGTQAVTSRAAAAAKTALRRDLLAAEVARGRVRVGATTTLATTGLNDLDGYYGGYLPALIAAATVPPLVGLRILAADWVSALVLVLTVPLIPVFMVLIGLHTRDRVVAAGAALARLSDHLVELARGLPVLVGLGRFEEQTAALRRISDEHRDRSLRVLRTAFLSSLALELLSTISVAIVAVLIGIRLLAGGIGLEAGLIALILAPEVFAPLREVGAAFHASESGTEAGERARRRIADPRPPAGPARRVGGDGLVVTDLVVRHAGRAAPATPPLTFTARRGAAVLLAGASGAGKSTVLDVLAGRGAALDAEASTAGSVRLPGEVAWLPQHPRTSEATTTAELLRYAADGTLPADVRRVLARLGIAALADADPAECSPGEQRRIAFARVLLRVEAGAAVALLDEPTAHLDPASAAVVRREIAALTARVAVVLASHDPATAALASVVVPVDGTRVRPGAPLPAPTGPAVVAREHAEPAPSTAAAAPLRLLATVLAPAGGTFAAAVAVGALATAFAVALLGVSGWLIVRAAAEPSIMFLTVAMVGVRFFGIGRAALRYAERLLTHRAVLTALTDLRVRLWRGLAARGPVARALLTPGAALDGLIGDADRVRDLTPRVVAPLASGVVAAAGAVLALALVLPAAGPAVAVAVLVGALAVPAATAALAARSERAADAGRSAAVRRIAALLGAAEDLAGNGVDDRVRREVVAHAAAVDTADARGQRIAAAGQAGTVLLAGGTAVALVAAAVPAVASGALAPALVAVLALVPLALVDPLQDMVAAAVRWPRLRAVLVRVAAVVEPAPWVVGDAGAAVLRPVERIRLEDLTAGYPGGEPVFRGVRAAAGRGEHLVVAGPSGSGKSTLLAVLLRYLDPSAGEVRLGDVDERSVRPATVRRHLAWCPQEAHLFDSTLRGNLLLARPREDAPADAELEAVLRGVGLGPLLRDLPAGLDAPVGPAGGFLSGGQRQRLAVARTLLTGADVLLLDEPTAHLDREAADALLADARRAARDRVLVTVTHDVELLEQGDRALLLPGAAAPLPA